MKISTDQPLGDLAILLLEPQSPDSLLQWGFFNPIFTRTEYIEDYAVEPLAAKMLKEDPKLQAAFNKALKTQRLPPIPRHAYAGSMSAALTTIINILSIRSTVAVNPAVKNGKD